MAFNLGAVTATLNIKGIKNVERGLARMEKRFNKTIRRIQTQIKNFTAIGMAGLVATLGLAGGQALRSADSFQTATLKYETLLGNVEDATQRVDELLKFSAKTPFRFDNIQKGDIILQKFGIRSEKMLQTVADASAITGSGFSELSLILGQLSQDKSLENIKQLVERGVIGFQELEEAGITFAKDRSVVNSVEETYGAVIGIIEKNFAGGAERVSRSLGGKLTTLLDNLNIKLGELAETTGIYDQIINGIDRVIQVLQQADIAKIVGDTTKFISENWLVIESILVALATVFIPLVVIALGKMAVATVLATWPFILMVAVIAGLYYAFRTNLWGIRDIVQNVANFFVDTYHWLKRNFFDVLAIALIPLTGGASLLYFAWKDNLWGLRDIVDSVVGFITDKFNQAIDLFNKVKDGAETIGGIVSGLGNIDIPGFAKGTDFAPGGLALVGERGPELVNLPRGSQVKTNEETRDIIQNDMGSKITINQYGSNLDSGFLPGNLIYT